ncbi:MAG: hypothetical protein Q9159_001924 [Coniocarpon cinnabarinum]
MPFDEHNVSRGQSKSACDLSARVLGVLSSNEKYDEIMHTTSHSPFPAPSSLLLPTPKDLLTTHPSPTSGYGLFAADDLPAYTQILAEHPLISMSPGEDLPHLYTRFKALTTSEQRNYLSLSRREDAEKDHVMRQKLSARGHSDAEIAEMLDVAGIFQSNAFNFSGPGAEDGDVVGRGVFSRVARVNHSCAPNAHVCYYPPAHRAPLSLGSQASVSSAAGGREGLGMMVLHTTRSIARGEEITISYFNLLLPRRDRQARARDWGFNCACAVCSSAADGDAEALRDEVRDWIRQQYRTISNPSTSVDQLRGVLSDGEALVHKVEQDEGLVPALPLLHERLAKSHQLLTQKNGDHQECEGHDCETVAWKERAVLAEAKITGLYSPATAGRVAFLRENQKGKVTLKMAEDGLKVLWE